MIANSILEFPQQKVAFITAHACHGILVRVQELCRYSLESSLKKDGVSREGGQPTTKSWNSPLFQPIISGARIEGGVDPTNKGNFKKYSCLCSHGRMGYRGCVE